MDYQLLLLSVLINGMTNTKVLQRAKDKYITRAHSQPSRSSRVLHLDVL